MDGLSAARALGARGVIEIRESSMSNYSRGGGGRVQSVLTNLS